MQDVLWASIIQDDWHAALDPLHATLLDDVTWSLLDAVSRYTAGSLTDSSFKKSQHTA